MDLSKQVLTTGQVAKICRVAPRTVSKWFDTGQLRGYRIPGSKDRRIPLPQLIRFMKAYGIPMDGLKLMDKPRALIVDEDPDLLQLIARSLEETGRFETRVAESAFEAGAVVSEFHPQTIVTDVDIPGISGRVLTRWLAARAETRDTVLVGMSASMTETDRQALLQEGFAETIAKPFSIRQLLAVLDNVVAVTA
ncbi:MAG TPA: response regulator [Phycisphaerae bacterium]|nr:response regulator [Phycisphaerae bacterium]HOJ73425.1 response regulator [Phycisphaerae bacterium]HOM51034.1 response regulator [Phycisphaerae bacterium]HON66317.1 response regulator [Phycisphaerae bacterium]HOQ85191.1 response regulator [Phycisphaerae bacterium]